MILCYACRHEPSITVSWETSPSRWCKQMQRLTTKYQAELSESCGRVKDRIEGAIGVEDTTRRSSESTHGDWNANQRLGQQELVLGPQHIVADQMCSLVFILVSEQWEQVLSMALLSALSLPEQTGRASEEENVPSSVRTWCPRVEWCPRGFFPLSEENR